VLDLKRSHFTDHSTTPILTPRSELTDTVRNEPIWTVWAADVLVCPTPGTGTRGRVPRTKSSERTQNTSRTLIFNAMILCGLDKNWIAQAASLPRDLLPGHQLDLVKNGSQAFRYDLDDPMGDRPGARLLSTYLDTRRGNCVSMPTLFLALMERVDSDIPFNGVSAPLHLFCRYRDRQDGQVWNVEATNGGHSMRDEWLMQQFAIEKASIDSGVYMKDLTKREYLAELIGGVVSLYRERKQYQRALELTEIVLALNPNSLIGLVHKGAIYAWLGYNLEAELSRTGRSPTPEEIVKLELCRSESTKYINRATLLGWHPETPESQRRYLETIEAAKKQR
jgi:hypothetical protein